jgi:AhpD family alkylhydroperoxidase
MSRIGSSKQKARRPAKAAGRSAKSRRLYTPAVEELVAIGAAIACNCERCFKHHYLQARRLGVTHDDMASAVAIAQKVKNSPARAILELAQRHLHGAAIPTDDTAAHDACARPELDEPDNAPSPCCSSRN